MTTRGIRNNNPGNIVRDGTPWLGLAKTQPDPRFCSFDTAEHGIRALARVLLNYQSLHHLNTLAAIIHRWAPPVENDTDAYVAAVAKHVGVSPMATLHLQNVGVMRPLVEAIIAHENGGNPYTPAQITAGLLQAGFVDAGQTRV